MRKKKSKVKKPVELASKDIVVVVNSEDDDNGQPKLPPIK